MINGLFCIRDKDVKMSASKEMDKSDFMIIESTLNVSKVSIFKVSNTFLEIFFFQNLVEIIYTLSSSVTIFM